MRRARRIERTLTDAERVRLAALRMQIEAEKEAIIAEGRRHKAAHDGAAKLSLMAKTYNDTTSNSL